MSYRINKATRLLNSTASDLDDMACEAEGDDNNRQAIALYGAAEALRAVARMLGGVR